MQLRALWFSFVALSIAVFVLFLRTPDGASLTPAPSSESLDFDARRIEARLKGLEEGLASISGAAGVPVRRAAPMPPGSAELDARLARLEALVASMQKAGSADHRSQIRKLTDAIARGASGDLLAQLRSRGGIDVNLMDDNERTPLGAAAIAGRIETFDALLAAKAELERTFGRRGMTPLLAAPDADQEAAALALLQRGADPRAVDKNGENALHWAAFNGLDGVVRRLLASGVEVDFKSHDGSTALCAAARRGHRTIAELLLRAGANPNVAIRGSGATPVSLARSKGHQDLIQLLRRYGARD